MAAVTEKQVHNRIECLRPTWITIRMCISFFTHDTESHVLLDPCSGRSWICTSACIYHTHHRQIFELESIIVVAHLLEESEGHFTVLIWFPVVASHQVIALGDVTQACWSPKI